MARAALLGFGMHTLIDAHPSEPNGLVVEIFAARRVLGPQHGPTCTQFLLRLSLDRVKRKSDNVIEFRAVRSALACRCRGAFCMVLLS